MKKVRAKPGTRRRARPTPAPTLAQLSQLSSTPTTNSTPSPNSPTTAADPAAATSNGGTGNRFRFLGFSERLAQVRIDVAHRVAPLALAPEEDDSSFFEEALVRWMDLDLSRTFASLRRAVSGKTQSLALVLHHRQELLDVLLEHLCEEECTSRRALLDLLAMLARDLRGEFMPFFPRVARQLAELIDPSEPEQLQLLFECLGFLLKFLAKQLVAEVVRVFREVYVDLLAHRKPHVRVFAAESFGYLLRKVSRKRAPEVYEAIMSLPPDDSDIDVDNLRNGVAALLFEAVRSVQHGFHSSTARVLPLMLGTIRSAPSQAQLEYRQDLLSRLLRRACNHTRRSKTGVVWSCLVDHLSKKNTAAMTLAQRTHAVSLLHLWLTFRKGSRVEQCEPLVSVVKRLISRSPLSKSMQPADSTADATLYIREVLGCFVALWKVAAYTSSPAISTLHATLPKVFPTKIATDDATLHAAITNELASIFFPDSFGADLASLVDQARPLAVQYANALCTNGHTLCAMRLLLAMRRSESSAPMDILSAYHKASAAPTVDASSPLAKAMVKVLNAGEPRDVVYAVIKLVPFLGLGADNRPLAAKLLGPLTAALPRLLDAARESAAAEARAATREHTLTFSQNADVHVYGCAVRSRLLLAHATSKSLDGAAMFEQLLGLLADPVWCRSPAVLSALLTLLRLYDARGREDSMLQLTEVSPPPSAQIHSYASFATPEALELTITALQSTASSPSPVLRTLVCEILRCFPLPEYETHEQTSEASEQDSTPALSKKELKKLKRKERKRRQKGKLPPAATPKAQESSYQGECNALPLCADVAQMAFAPTLGNERELVRLMRLVERMCAAGRTPAVLVRFLVHFGLGVFRVRFRPIFSVTCELLASLAKSHADVFWDVWFTHVRDVLHFTRVTEPDTFNSAAALLDNKAESSDNADAFAVIAGDADPTAQLLHQTLRDDMDVQRPITDNQYYFALLMQTAAEHSSVSQVVGRNRDAWLGVMMEFMREYDQVFPADDDHELRQSSFAAGGHGRRQERLIQHLQHKDDQEVETVLVPGARRITNRKLEHFLKVFEAAFPSASSAIGQPMHDRLFALFTRLLSKSDADIQMLALGCVLCFHVPYLKPYKERVQRLIQDKTFREELTLFHLASDQGMLVNEHREQFLPILIKVLLPKLLRRKLSGVKSTLSARRAAILSYLSIGLQSHELAHLYAELLRPFRAVIAAFRGFDADTFTQAQLVEELRYAAPLTLEAVRRAVRTKTPHAIPVSKQLGFLKVLAFLANKLRFHVRPVLPDVFVVVLHSLHHANEEIKRIADVVQEDEEDVEEEQEEEDEDEAGEDASDAEDEEDDNTTAEPGQGSRRKTKSKLMSRDFREVRQLCYTRFARLLTLFGEDHTAPQPSKACRGKAKLTLDLEPVVIEFLDESQPSLDRLPQERAGHRGGLLNSIVCCSKIAPMASWLCREQYVYIFDRMASLLVAPHTHPSVVDAVYEFMSNMLEWTFSDHARVEEKAAPSAEASTAAFLKSKIDVVRVTATGEVVKKRMRMIDAARAAEESDDGDEQQAGLMEVDEEESSDEEMEEVVEENAVTAALSARLREIWSSHISHVLAALQSRVQLLLHNKSKAPRPAAHAQSFYVQRGGNKRPQTRTSTTRELHIISRLSTFVTEPATADQLVALLVPLLQARGAMSLHDKAKMDVLRTVADMVLLITDPEFLAVGLSRQFLALRAPGTLSLLASVFVRLSTRLPELEAASRVLVELHSTPPEKLLEEFDYEARANGFGMFQSVCASLTPLALSPLVYAMLHALDDEELGVRSSALHCLRLVLQKHREQHGDKPDRIVTEVMFSSARNGLNSRSESVRRDMVRLVAEIARTFPQQFQHLQPLFDSDPDADFFDNIVHIQLHNRRKALRRVRDLCEPADGSESTLPVLALSQVVLPLTSHVLFEANFTGTTDESGARARSAVGKEHAMVEEAVRLISSLAKRFSWAKYQQMFRMFLRKIPLLPEREKLLVRVLCVIIDEFHFDLGGGGAAAAAAAAAAAGEDEADAEDDDEDEDEDGDEDMASAEQAARIRQRVVGSLIPELHTYLTSEVSLSRSMLKKRSHSFMAKSPATHFQVVRIPVAVALVKLLQKLPGDIFDVEFPRLVLVVCRLLAQRLDSTREAARQTLVRILTSVGPSKFSFILTSLCQTLRRGYELHVLGYVVNALLEALCLQTADPASGVAAGCLDYCMPQLSKFLVRDLLGEAGRQKKVAAIRNSMREARHNKALDAYENTAQLVGFNPFVTSLVEPLSETLETTNSLEDLKMIADALRHVTAGLGRNPSVDAESVLIFVYNTVKTANSLSMSASSAKSGVRGKLEQERDDTRKAKLRKLRMMVTKEEALAIPEIPQDDVASSVQRSNRTIMAEFALQLALRSFKINMLDARDEQTREMLGPYPQLMWECLCHSPSQSVVVLALKCFQHLARAGVESMDSVAGRLAARVFKYIHTSKATMLQPCFRTMAVLMRCYGDKIRLSNTQLQRLLQFVHNHLEDTHEQSVAFSLLKSVLQRKVMLPMIYDLIAKLGTMMVQAFSPQFQKQVAGLWLIFLLEYPLAEKRLHEHLGFLVNNLRYKRESGRMAALRLIESVIIRFPEKAVEDKAEFFFLPLVLVLANDTSSECRELAATALRTLAGRVGPAQLAVMSKFVFKWIETASSPMQLQQATAQVMGLMVEALDARVQGLLASRQGGNASTVDRQVHQLRSVLGEFVPEAVAKLHGKIVALKEAKQRKVARGEWVEESESEEEDEDEDTVMSVRRNKVAKGKTAAKEVTVGKEWRVVYQALVSVTRMVSSLPEVTVPVLVNSGLWRLVGQELLVHRHAWVRRVSARLVGTCFGSLDVASVDPAEEPLLGSSEELYLLSKVFLRQLDGHHLDEAHAEQVTKNLLFATVVLLRHPHEGEEEQEDDDDEEDDDQESEDEDMQGEELNRSVNWIVRRLSYQSRKGSVVKRMAAYRFFGAVAQVMPAAQLKKYLVPILSTVYRAAEHEAHSANQLALQELAREIIEVVQRVVGAEAFLPAYNVVRKSVVEVRKKRQRKRKMQAVRDPERYAKRKIARNKRKRERTKEKMEAIKTMRQEGALPPALRGEMGGAVQRALKKSKRDKRERRRQMKS